MIDLRLQFRPTLRIAVWILLALTVAGCGRMPSDSVLVDPPQPSGDALAITRAIVAANGWSLEADPPEYYSSSGVRVANLGPKLGYSQLRARLCMSSPEPCVQPAIFVQIWTVTSERIFVKVLGDQNLNPFPSGRLTGQALELYNRLLISLRQRFGPDHVFAHFGED
jgi:hypothetical protein